MVRKGILQALCLCYLALLSCQRQDADYADAGSVFFSVNSSFGVATKTQYSGGHVADGQKERIDWSSGDGFTILSPQSVIIDKTQRPWVLSYNSPASGPEYSVADYVIGGEVTSSGVFSISGITPTSVANDLHWGTGAHRFFGVYPMISSLPDTIKTGKGAGITTNTERTKGIITAYIPKAQTYSRTKAAGKSKRQGMSDVDSTHVYPQMQYAWMWSAQYTAKPDLDVDMYFSPMITTFQIAVQGSDAKEVPITRLELHSADDALQGTYKATVWVKDYGTVIGRSNLSDMNVAYSDMQTCTSGVNDVVSFTMPAGTVVSSKKKVTFTVFVYPFGNGGAGYLSGLTLRFVSVRSGMPDLTRSLALKDASKGWVQFPAGRKINIDGITLPEQLDPWHFSVTATNFENEMSDVVVSPVKVKEFLSKEGGNLDEME